MIARRCFHWFLACWLAIAPSAWAAQDLVIGVFANRPVEVMTATVTPLADYIQEILPHHRVRLRIMSLNELEAAIVSRQVDLVWTNATQFLLLRSLGNLNTLMATTITRHGGADVKSQGGVVFTRADRPEIRDFSQIQRLRVGIPDFSFFAGYQAIVYEFQSAGYALPGSNTLLPLGSHDAVVQAVLEGRVDVGFVRTGIIDGLRDDTGPVMQRLRVVQPQTFAGFPFVISTRLYPEWPFVALAHVDDEVVRRVAARLLALEPDHPAAVAAGLGGFAPPLDYLPVENVARALRLPPYDAPVSLTWQDIWERHHWAILGALLALLLLMALSGLLTWGNRRLNALLREQIRARRELQITASVFSSAREGILITNPQARIIDVNPAFTHITGYTKAEVVGRNPRFLSARSGPDGVGRAMWTALLSQGTWDGELLNRRKTGEPYHQLTTITQVKGPDGQPQRYISVFTDVTKQKEYEERLKRQAWSDELTGLANRTRFNELVAEQLPEIRQGTLKASVAYIDLDGFKAVNDRHGHYIGDQLLKALAVRLQQRIRPTDLLGRLGGDEFVILLQDHEPIPEQDPRLLNLLAALAAPVDMQGLRLQVSGSIGVAACTGAFDEDADLLIRQADQAMYQAKQQGRNRYQVFDRVKSVMEQDGHDTRRRMAEALSRQEFLLYYQPKVHMRTGQVLGVEALLRWQHPEQGLLAPGAFLGFAAGFEIDLMIGRWVIDQALEQMHVWSRLGIHLPVSVNVSGEHLLQDRFLDDLRASLMRHPELPAGSLEIEVLESSALTDIGRASSVVRECAAMGVTVALDDFGTGYSTLSYLKQLPAQTLKIDQSFIRSMLDDRDDLSILQGVLGLAEAFDRQTVAEGVETEMHGLMLLQLGCQYGQGYGIARPMPASDIPLWTRQWHPPASWQAAQVRSGLQLELLMASVHWQRWLRDLLSYVGGAVDHPPAMTDPVSPLVTLARQAHATGLPEGEWSSLCQTMVDLSHQAVAFQLAGQMAARDQARDQIQAMHVKLVEQLCALGYWAAPAANQG